MQDIDYLYDVRGWLKSINNLTDNTPRKLYAQQLAYNNNGNIASMTWKNNQQVNQQRYDFTYDGLNRMDNAVYSETNAPLKANFFDEDPTYDLNGNITGLVRMGNTVVSGFTKGLIDNLTYEYKTNSNQINRVTNGITSSLGHDKHYINGSANLYTYDANGNALFIPNKNLNVVYNYLNLPQRFGLNTPQLDIRQL